MTHWASHRPNGIDGPGGGHDRRHEGLCGQDGGLEEAVARSKIGGQGAVAIARGRAGVVVATLGRVVARVVARAVSRTVVGASTTTAVATAAVAGSGGSGGDGGGGGDGGWG